MVSTLVYWTLHEASRWQTYVISILLHEVILIRCDTSQSSTCQIVLRGLGGPHPDLFHLGNLQVGSAGNGTCRFSNADLSEEFINSWMSVLQSRQSPSHPPHVTGAERAG